MILESNFDAIKTTNGINALIHKLYDIKDNPSKKQLHFINQLAQRLAVLDANFKHEKKDKGVWFHKYSMRWSATKRVNGKIVHIKCSKDKEVCIQAYKDFCEKLNKI